MQESDFSQLANLFLSLSDKTRLRLLALLADGEVAVGFLADRLGESQPKISRHLAYLRNAGVVYTRRDGKWIYYGIEAPEDAAVRRVLEVTIENIAAVRADGEYVYLTETDMEDAAWETEQDVYAEAYESSVEPISEVEMDVFLL